MALVERWNTEASVKFLHSVSFYRFVTPFLVIYTPRMERSLLWAVAHNENIYRPQRPGMPPGPGTPPRPGTPSGTRYTPLVQVHPPRDQVHPLRTRYTPTLDQVHPPWDQVHPPGTTYTPPRDTATAADGTHPTGMHSCYLNTYSSRVKQASFFFSPSAFCFSITSLPRNGVSVFNLQVNPKTLSSGVSSRLRSPCQCL